MTKQRRKPSLLVREFNQSLHSSATPAFEWVSVASIRKSARNARTHSKRQIQKIAQSINAFGFVNPIIVDQNNRVMAGHGRLEAATMLGLSEVPIVRISHLTEPAIRAYMLADNKLAEDAGWDRELLALEVDELSILLPQVDLDLSVTGFEPSEIDSLFKNFGEDRSDPADDVPYLEPSRQVSRAGDLFILGRHRLLVADAREPQSFEKLMGTSIARMAILDPPYNVKVQGHVGGRGRIKHREFACASGEMSPQQFTSFLEQTLRLCAKHSIDGAIHYVFMDWRHMRRAACVFGVEERLRVDEEQCGSGFVLPLPTRTSFRIQARHCTSSEQFRAGPVWAHAFECLALCWREQLPGRSAGRASDAPHRQTYRAGR